MIDPDDDNDGVLDAVDNCPLNANPRQEISACLKSIAPQQFVAPGTDVRAAFIAPEKYFEPYQILVVPCLQRCGAPGDVVKTTLHVDSELPLELRVLDPRGEPVASGVSTESLTFEAAVGEDGLALHYRLEIVPSPEFEAGREYPFTAGISEPRF